MIHEDALAADYLERARKEREEALECKSRQQPLKALQHFDRSRLFVELARELARVKEEAHEEARRTE